MMGIGQRTEARSEPPGPTLSGPLPTAHQGPLSGARRKFLLTSEDQRRCAHLSCSRPRWFRPRAAVLLLRRHGVLRFAMQR